MFVSTGNVNLIVAGNDNFVGRYARSSGTFDPEELAFIKTLIQPGSNMIEVGANIGTYSVHIGMHLGPGGTLYCYEPFRLIYQILTANIALNGLSNVHTFQVGISNISETNKIAAGPNLNSVDNYGAASLLDEKDKTWILTNPEMQKVTLVTLDSQSFDTKIDLIKIDAEGMEFEVIRGAFNLISRDKPIIYTENSVEKTDPGMSFETLMNLSFQYECSRPAQLLIHNIVLCLPVAI